MQHPQFTETGAGRRPIFVIGHKNPDTDSICAAIGYAELLRRTRLPEAVAACCGGLNARTKWVLEQAKVSAPTLILDVRPTAEMICRADVIKAQADETFLEVYQRMDQAEIRAIPIVDDADKVVGLASAQDLLHLLLHPQDTTAHARRVRTSLANIAKTLQGVIDCGVDLPVEEDFILTVSASSEATVDARLHEFPAQQLVVVVGDRPEVHRLALGAKVRALVLTGGAHLSAELMQQAKDGRVSVISSRHDTASTVQLIRCSRRIAEAVEHGCLTFGAKTSLESVRHQIQHSNQALFPVVDDETGSLLGVFSKSDLLDPPLQRLILVDHNEFSQAVPGAAEANILEVIDHHRLSGNLVTREPIRFINEPVGSTSTIVAKQFSLHSQTPDRATALCLLAGIVSDTLKLTSPTTTHLDREMLWWLAGIAAVDVDAFTRDFFAAGSLLLGAGVETILHTDRKEFSESGWSISISQIEELGLDAFPQRHAELQSALESLRASRKFDFACLLITDVLRHASLLLTSGHPEIIREIDCKKLGENLYELPGVVSRKKQFFPLVARVLAAAREVWGKSGK